MLGLLSPTWQLSRTPTPAWASLGFWELHSKTVFPLHSEWPGRDGSQETLWFPACLVRHGNLRGLALKLPKRKTGKDGWEWRALGRSCVGWVSVPDCRLAKLFPSTPDASEQELPVTTVTAVLLLTSAAEAHSLQRMLPYPHPLYAQ